MGPNPRGETRGPMRWAYSGQPEIPSSPYSHSGLYGTLLMQWRTKKLRKTRLFAFTDATEPPFFADF
jgi:hypothetical protein